MLDMMCKNTKLWTPGVGARHDVQKYQIMDPTCGCYHDVQGGGATLMSQRAHDVQRRGATLMSHFSATHPLQNGPISIILDPKWLIPWS